MQYSTNYNFKKPDQLDNYNVDDFNDNADAIDGAIKDHVDRTPMQPEGVHGICYELLGQISGYVTPSIPSTTYTLEQCSIQPIGGGAILPGWVLFTDNTTMQPAFAKPQ